jgi:hypothetical protein
MSNNLTVPLKTKTDRDGRKYFVGKVRFPGNITCKDGICFLVFLADPGAEEIQICTMEDNNRDDQ